MSDAIRVRLDNEIRKTAAAAVVTGKIHQLADGRAGVYTGLNAAALGDRTNWAEDGQYSCPKKPSVVCLDGGPAYWDRANGYVTPLRPVSGRGFFLGTFVGDAASADATCTVNVNVAPSYVADLARDAFTTAAVGTQVVGAFGGPHRRGGTNKLLLGATNEAQKIDAFGNDGFDVTANGIVEMGINVVSVGAGAAPDLSVGLANATHATDADAITQHLFLHVDGNSTAIKFQSKDGTTTVAAADSLQVLVAGTRFEVWFDMRDETSVKIYVNGVRVLAGTVFNVAAANGTLRLLAHLEKTAAVDTFEADVDWLRARIAEQ